MRIHAALGMAALSLGHFATFVQPVQAHETSNIVIYGLVDSGLSYYSNSVALNGGQIAASGSALRLDNGIAAGNRVGFSGSEDLGGGMSAVFKLENGFDAAKGSMGQGGLLFGRQSYVGLNTAAGLWAIGRQYDFMFDYLNLMGYTNAGHNNIGASGQGLDGMSAIAATAQLGNHTYGARVNNALKFSSNSFSGFRFGALLGLGEQAGSQSRGSSAQAGLNYGQGNLLIGAVAGVSSVPGSDSQYATKRLAGAGAKLTLDKLALYGSYTQVHFDGLVSYAARGISWKGARVDTLDIGADYQFTPVVNGGLSWQHQTRNSDLGAADQVTASLSYSLSKRTSLYSTVAYQHDRAFGALNVFGAGTPSSNGVQVVSRVAMRTAF
ncbi:porin [Herbaspirillum sp. C7C2]|uniref:porin n=1 Tax=Herbaspirillum sp. C7C2 TaxID=2736666 RepID=UPI001F51EC72|nr:porin [Herbaspirillum sp. C7C2]MCI1014572.1 porin [Herbaspirillum sp. C7C2]